MEYVGRVAERRLAELLGDFPAVLINGPRAVGKTTTAARLAADVVKLNDPAQAAAFIADPGAALRLHREPLLLDEWQEVPDVLRAVRDAVDRDSCPGRFILTGSVRAGLENKVWPGTGRLIRLNMYGLTQAEINGSATGANRRFIERLALGDPAEFTFGGVRPDLPKYIEMLMRGGFPEVALKNLSARSREDWFDSYLDQLLTRDMHLLSRRRDSHKMREYFEALAANTAGQPTDSTLIAQARINARTASSYDLLLQHLFVTESVPGWARRRSARLVGTRKRYVVDPALAASAAGITAQTILADAGLLGRMIDTFASAQLRPELALMGSRIRRYHLRTKEGRQEVDLVIELPGGKIMGIEFKAAAAVSRTDARHLSWLRDLAGQNFVAGAVLHTGPSAFQIDDRILALPISTLWGE